MQVPYHLETPRESVWTLVRLAWRAGAFSDATKALALLAEAETESWANNATAEFVGRFQIIRGGTAVPYLDRLAVLDELAATNRAPLVRLVVQALAQVGDRQAFRMGSEPASDEVPEKEWHPSPGREHLECVLAALQRLTHLPPTLCNLLISLWQLHGYKCANPLILLDRRGKMGLTTLASRGTAELEGDFVSAAKSLAMMPRDGPVRSAVATLFEAVRTVYPEAREPLRQAIADVVYRERKYWKQLPEEELAELDALHAGFEEASLPARLRQLVGQSRWDRDEQPDLRPFARELVESPTTLVEMWPWLTSGDAADGWRLGEPLAEEDPEGQLLDLVQNVDGAGRDLRVLRADMF
jgi:hypothetical protein